MEHDLEKASAAAFAGQQREQEPQLHARQTGHRHGRLNSLDSTSRPAYECEMKEKELGGAEPTDSSDMDHEADENGSGPSIDEDEGGQRRPCPAQDKANGDAVIPASPSRAPAAGDVPSSGPLPPLAARDHFEVGWDGGDDDPMNPRSMTAARKWSIVFVTCFGSLCVTCASSIYVMTYDGMDAEFGNSRIVATLGLSMFVVGLALGPAWSPMSEFYGRRPIYLGSILLFIIWVIPAAVAKNIETVIVARAFQGLSGSAFLSVSGGTVGDLFPRDKIAAPMAFFSVVPLLGPSMGPLIGGFINSWASWRWTHYVMIIWGAILLAALLVVVPETYHPVLLRNKARQLRASTGDDRWYAPLEKFKSNASLSRTIARQLQRPFQLLIFEPMCLLIDVYSAIILGVVYLFFGAFPLVFDNNHHFKLWETGLSFMGLFFGMIIGTAMYPVWDNIRKQIMTKRQLASGDASPHHEPEDRLPPLMAGCLIVPVGLFWFGWTSYPSIHWIVPILGSGVFSIGLIWCFSGAFTFLVDAYPLYAASALAANAMVRCIFAASFPLFGIQMYNKLGYQWATTLLAFLTVAMMPFPFLFFKYGKRLRSRSRFATD